MAPETILIKIVNWHKYNTRRKDVKSYAWFRFNHDFFYDDKIYELGLEEKLFLIYLLCECSRSSSPQTLKQLTANTKIEQNSSPQDAKWLTVSTKKAHRMVGFDEKSIHRTIEKLKQLQIVEVRTLRGRYGSVTGTLQTRYATQHNITEHNITLHNRTEQDITCSGGGAKRTSPNKTNIEGNFGEVVNSHTEAPVKNSSKTKLVWEAYANAYFDRYKTEPVRNAMVNGQLTNFIKRVGEAEAPDIARFYLTHNGSFYVQKMHSVGMLLADAEKLRTEWATGTQLTSHASRAIDRTQTNVNVFKQILEEMKDDERN